MHKEQGTFDQFCEKKSKFGALNWSDMSTAKQTSLLNMKGTVK